jgi:SanA protein
VTSACEAVAMPMLLDAEYHRRSSGKTMQKSTRRRKILLRSAVAAVFLLLAFSLIANVLICQTEPFIYTSIEEIPQNDVGLVLGTARSLRNGMNNLHFDNRIMAAAQLFKSGKVKHLLVSGDNHIQGYDEPTDMRDALVQLGVPSDCITCDYAGFRTLDSVVRAKKVFGQEKFTIISQRYHNYRALAIARHHGLCAVAFCASDVPWQHSAKTEIREYFARTKAALDLYIFNVQPHFLGPHVDVTIKGPQGQSHDS